MSPLTPEQIADLVSYSTRKQRHTRVPFVDAPQVNVVTSCSACGVFRDERGYCINENCSIDRIINTYPCVYCGHCASPGACVWSTECPVCLVIPGDICVNPVTRAFVVLHEERWELVQAVHGTHYTGNDTYGINHRALRLLT